MVVSSSRKNPSTPTRPPLTPSEKTNGAAGAALHKKPPKSKDVITSRYLSSPSPLPIKRAASASRPRRPPDHSSSYPATATRSLSVSFQGHSFSLHTAAGDKPAPAKPRTPRTPLFDTSEEDVDVRLSSDSDSSGSSPTQEAKVPLRPAPRGLTVPARFRAATRRTAAAPPPPRRAEAPPGSGGACQVVGKFPSVVNFAAEATRGKSRRAEEAHALRLLHNRHLQWRCVNARAGAALSAQRRTVEQNLYNTAIALSEMHDSVSLKGIELQLRTQGLKLSSILEGQMTYLEEWSLMDREHRSSLSGTMEALKASTLRLPIVGGAKVNIHELQNAVGSAVELMQALGTSTHSLLLKVDETNALASELAKAAAHERTLLDQSKDLLLTVAAMHVKQCSLQGHILQSKRNANLVQF